MTLRLIFNSLVDSVNKDVTKTILMMTGKLLIVDCCPDTPNNDLHEMYRLLFGANRFSDICDTERISSYISYLNIMINTDFSDLTYHIPHSDDDIIVFKSSMLGDKWGLPYHRYRRFMREYGGWIKIQIYYKL